MTHRALLLGAAYGTLLHVPRSLDRLEAALGRHGFTEVERQQGLGAEALLAAIDRLIAVAAPGDPVALVYVGHGGRRDEFGYLLPEPGRSVVIGLELGDRLARLAEKTGNLTVILDCCHASGLVEDASHLTDAQLRELVARRRAVVRGDGLQGVVQLLAAAPPETAHEDLARREGLFSGVLADVLEQVAGLEVAWREVLDEVRLRMRRVTPHQSPTLVGRHRERVPFTARDSTLRHDDIACGASDDGLRLEAGALQRIAVGQRLRLRALGRPLDRAAPLVDVTAVAPDHAILRADGPALAGAPGLRAVRSAPAIRDGQPLVQPDAPRLPERAHDVRWGRVDAGRYVRLPARGAVIGRDDDLWIAFGTRRNEVARELYFTVFQLDRDGRRTLLAPAYPQGLALPNDRDFLLATHLPARNDRLTWPKGQPPGDYAWLCLISNQPLVVDALEDRGPVTRGARRPPARYAEVELRFTVA